MLFLAMLQTSARSIHFFKSYHRGKETCSQKLWLVMGHFPQKRSLIDLLDDYNTCQLPTIDNVKSLLLHISTPEFVTKPFLCLASIRLGMGQLWDNVRKEEVEALYEMSRPTAAHIIGTLVLNPKNPKEGQINGWSAISRVPPAKSFPVSPLLHSNRYLIAR